jgi:hypothetical protein
MDWTHGEEIIEYMGCANREHDSTSVETDSQSEVHPAVVHLFGQEWYYTNRMQIVASHLIHSSSSPTNNPRSEVLLAQELLHLALDVSLDNNMLGSVVDVNVVSIQSQALDQRLAQRFDVAF